MESARTHPAGANEGRAESETRHFASSFSNFAFIEATDALLVAQYPGATIVNFGHLGDGNLHYNVAPPIHIGDPELSNWELQVNRLIHDSVEHFKGSFFADHGVGILRREEVMHYKSPVEIRLMEAVKLALDPDNLMNPGKVL